MGGRHALKLVTLKGVTNPAWTRCHLLQSLSAQATVLLLHKLCNDKKEAATAFALSKEFRARTDILRLNPKFPQPLNPKTLKPLNVYHAT